MENKKLNTNLADDDSEYMYSNINLNNPDAGNDKSANVLNAKDQQQLNQQYLQHNTTQQHLIPPQHQHNIPLINAPNIGSNMVPIISVTPHSPGTKYYSILDDTLNQLQNIRESVVQMKKSTVQMQLSSLRSFSSCPSLPTLLSHNAVAGIWPAQQYLISSDRRKSWTAIENLTECTKSSHKSVSLSSLDSEEQESIRAAERHRSSRNSTGGISTHSLNEAELVRDFERIAAKRNLTPVLMNRVSLKKSISTPSIAPLRISGAKEENDVSTIRHLSDSEDDNQDDRSLLCVRDKTEVYTDHSEKRRKRGSLFFRKKKDKTKSKTQSTTCDACGAQMTISHYKEHMMECKQKISKHQSSKSGIGKKGSANSHSTHHDDSRDYYDGYSQNEHSNYSDDTPLIRIEFLNEPAIGPQDLGADPILGIEFDEYDSWSPGVPKEIVKSLKDKQIKRQEHIYEFIMTEKHHCQTLLVMQKLFVEGIQKHFSQLNIDRLFPRLQELTELHMSFLKMLRIRQKENYVVSSISDILLDFFSSSSAVKLKNAYGEFCSNHRSALEKFKYCTASDQTFAEWYKHCLTNPLLKKKGIPECILFVTQRLTKYPLLIDPLLKSSREDPTEQERLQKAMTLVKEILVEVDARVADKEKQDRQLEIFKCIDGKSSTMYKNKPFRKSDIGVGTHRRLKFEGYATLLQGRSKMQNVLVVVLSDCLFFLQETSHNKYIFFTPENKAGVVSLQKLLIREKAGTESRSIYIISSNPALPEMYELKVQNPKDKNVWIQAIRTAVLECPSDDCEIDDLSAEEKQKLVDAKQANMREMLEKLRQKDIEHSILLEEKIAIQLNLLKELRDLKNVPDSALPTAEDFLVNFGSYKDLLTDDCDAVGIWERVANTIQQASDLASTLYTAATGLPPPRTTSTLYEKQNDAFSSPTLPKRAETFGGFDEKRTKNNLPWREAVLSTLPITPLSSSDSKKTSTAGSGSNLSSSNNDNISNSDNLSTQGSLTNSSGNNNLLRTNTDSISLKNNNFAALQVSHNLHTLLCIISQQMTAINNLQTQLATYRGNKTFYKHNDQLEELRNLQDKLQEEKHIFLKQKEQTEKDIYEREKSLDVRAKEIQAQEQDIKTQRAQLFRLMEKLQTQGIIISPNSPLPIATNAATAAAVAAIHANDINEISVDTNNANDNTEINLTEKRKEKWKSGSIPKTPPVNLLSATNAPKVNQASIKQQIPMKLSSLSSTKSDKSLNCSSTISPIHTINTSSGITQMLPLKLADKKTNQNMTPNHSRTGSSPAIIQQPTLQPVGNPATRTNTYPKLPERYRIRSSDISGLTMQGQTASLAHQLTHNSSFDNSSSATTATLPLSSSSSLCYPTFNSSSIHSSLVMNANQHTTTPTTILTLSTASTILAAQKSQTSSSSNVTNNRVPSFSSSPSLISTSVGITTVTPASVITSSTGSSAFSGSVISNADAKQQQPPPEVDEEEIYF